MTSHTIRATVPLNDDGNEFSPTLDITFSYLRGHPATGPSYSCGGEPADPDEVDLISAAIVDGDGLTSTPEQVDLIARAYLESDEGYQACCNLAGGEQGPDPDELYDRSRDEPEIWEPEDQSEGDLDCERNA